MRKLLTTIITAAVVLTNTTAAFAAPSPEYWEIQNFNSDITLNTDGTFNVTESITADFTNEAHRGIGRVIPEGSSEIEFIKSVNENGEEWVNTIRRYDGNIDIESLNQELEYRTDINTYLISYLVRFAYKFFEDHDEFHWNVNGTEWPVQAQRVSATVHLPDNLNQNDIQLACNTGAYGSTEEECTYEFTDENTVEFKANQAFDRYENLTIVVGMPVGTIAQPTAAEKRNKLLKEMWPLTIPIAVFAIMFTLWYRNGRDERVIKTTIIPHYHPPNGLLPTETGTIIDEKLDSRDITATIIHYAIKGYIKITETENKISLLGKRDHELELLKPYKTEKIFERVILDGIFPINEAGVKIKISKLENNFYKTIPEIKRLVMTQLIRDGYFPSNPMTIRKIYMGIASTIGILAIQLNLLLGVFLTGGLIISAITIAGFGYIMPKKTKKGTETYYVLKGLYEYINTAEKDRLKFQEANNIMFEKLLPYAMAFGIAKKWAKAFDGIIKTSPSWYYSPYDSFSMLHLSRSLGGFEKQINSTLPSSPSSSSSGFGGGGGGGGGGR